MIPGPSVFPQELVTAERTATKIAVPSPTFSRNWKARENQIPPLWLASHAWNGKSRRGFHFSSVGAPVKRASARVKVPSVQLDGSAPQTVPTASPRGGVGSRHGVEPAGRNEHMNHINEPRKTTPGSRAPQRCAKAEELEPGLTVVGSDNGPAGSAWATCWKVTHG